MVECNAQFSRKLENVEKEIKNLNIKMDKCNQNASEQQKGDKKALLLERICSKIYKLTKNVKSITEKQNELSDEKLSTNAETDRTRKYDKRGKNCNRDKKRRPNPTCTCTTNQR